MWRVVVDAHHPVMVVEVEVAAAGEVGEGVVAPQAGAPASRRSRAGSSVSGSSIASTGWSRPTQIVTRRPSESNVIEAHSRKNSAEEAAYRAPAARASGRCRSGRRRCGGSTPVWRHERVLRNDRSRDRAPGGAPTRRTAASRRAFFGSSRIGTTGWPAVCAAGAAMRGRRSNAPPMSPSPRRDSCSEYVTTACDLIPRVRSRG